jgi:hypothetical protein
MPFTFRTGLTPISFLEAIRAAFSIGENRAIHPSSVVYVKNGGSGMLSAVLYCGGHQ